MCVCIFLICLFIFYMKISLRETRELLCTCANGNKSNLNLKMKDHFMYLETNFDIYSPVHYKLENCAIRIHQVRTMNILKFWLECCTCKKTKRSANYLESSSGEQKYQHKFNGQLDVDFPELLLKNQHLLDQKESCQMSLKCKVTNWTRGDAQTPRRGPKSPGRLVSTF